MRKYIIIFTIFLLKVTLLAAQPKVVHTLVALCGGPCQWVNCGHGELGDAQSPRTNLYWGALYGVLTCFRQNPDWKQVYYLQDPNEDVAERIVFKHGSDEVFLVADAYWGCSIKAAIEDFFQASAGMGEWSISIENYGEIDAGGASDLIVYMGHDGLMDFSLTDYPESTDNDIKAIILSCKSSEYFREGLVASGAYPLLWTKQFMAPEAYILEAALEGWIKGSDDEHIRIHAAEAYSQYQKCSLNSALAIFKTGW